MMEAFVTYGEGPGAINWGGHVLPLNVAGTNYHGLYLSFAWINNPAHAWHNKHIAAMQCLELNNTCIFCVCEDGYVDLRTGAYGTNPVIVTKEGNLYQQNTGYTYLINGLQQQIPLPEGTSQGFAYIIDGVITWMDQVIGHNTPVYGGQKFVRAYQVNEWVFGQSLSDNIIAWNFSTNKLYQVYGGVTQVAPRGNSLGSEMVGAISEPGLFIPGDSFVQIGGPTPPDPPNPPDGAKKIVLEKLQHSLTPQEINYLISLVQQDIDND